MNVQDRLEKFGIVDQETGELVIDKIAEKKNFIDRGVHILVDIDNSKEDLKTILEDAKEAGYDKKQVKLLIDNVFKNTIREKISELEAIETEIHNLYEGGEDE